MKDGELVADEAVALWITQPCAASLRLGLYDWTAPRQEFLNAAEVERLFFLPYLELVAPERRSREFLNSGSDEILDTLSGE